MSRNKLKEEKTHKSILAQFFILLVGLGLLCGALFLVLHTTVGSALESYVYSSDFLSNVTEKRVNDLQEYVTENQVSATDSQALSQWMRGKPLTLMEIYRSNVLVYSSYASYSLAVEGGDFTWTATEGEETPTYDWISYYTVDFADGQGEVVLYSNELYRYSTYATMVEIILCAALFLLGFLIAFQRTVSYMRQISLEIQAMEGGDLNRPITVRGDNDLTALAESLDAMRLAFRAHITQDHRPDICHKRRARSRLRKHNSMIAVIWVCNSRILSRSFPVKSSRINDNASKCCSVPADKLCGRMYDNIRSMFDRPNPIRRSKRIIHHKRDLIFVS